jgi:hypothetical protein
MYTKVENNIERFLVITSWVIHKGKSNFFSHEINLYQKTQNSA